MHAPKTPAPEGMQVIVGFFKRPVKPKDDDVPAPPPLQEMPLAPTMNVPASAVLTSAAEWKSRPAPTPQQPEA